MTLFWRTLEDWTTQQDYVWFLALLAWGGVIAADLKRASPKQRPQLTWLGAFAVCAVIGFVVQLALLTRSIKTPYIKTDVALGLAQAAGTCALFWGATAGWAHARGWRNLGCSILLAFACARWDWPVQAGLALAVAQAGVVAVLASRQRLATGPAMIFILLPIIATHGPWAYAILHGRRDVDWSHFALIESGSWLALGTWFAVTAWRRRWLEVAERHSNADRLARDFRRALATLAIWVVCGLGFSVWYGRQTRQAYEDFLARRIELLAQLIDPKAVALAIPPDLPITKIEHKFYPSGAAVDVATMPVSIPAYEALYAPLNHVQSLGGELIEMHLSAVRQGEVVLFSWEPRKTPPVTWVIHHHATSQDYERLARGKSFILGPYRSAMYGTRVETYAPIKDPDTGKVVAWLVGNIAGARWAASFTMARLQTMVLVGVGLGFWTLSLAYRLRREARDDAERKAAESAAADRMKSTFLAKVSHELRTPIQSVLGYGELLASASLPMPQAQWVTALHSHGEVMLRLVNDLIDLGALQSGAFRLELGPVALRTLIGECVTALQPAATEKRLSLQTQIAADVPLWVSGDGVRLRQILLNLLKNAVKFTSAGKVSLTIRRHQSEVDFVIADTGPGIPAAQRDRLFKPFARLDPTSASGSGLGLALVHGLAQAMGGEIWLEPDTGVGATFVVRLPLSPCAPPDPAPSSAPATFSLQGVTILVAEDNTLVRELLVTFLQEHGAKVSVAIDGAAAESLARAQPPDVLLLDIGLPERDGISVATALRADGPAKMRIIGLSAHAGPQEEARARLAGMNDFLTKPVSFTRLAHALQSNSPLTAAAEHLSDAGLRATLLAQFASETPSVLQQMEAAAAAEDWESVRNRAHYLKNSADVIGARPLQDACRQLMLIDGRPDPGVVRQLLTAVLAAVPAASTRAHAPPEANPVDV